MTYEVVRLPQTVAAMATVLNVQAAAGWTLVTVLKIDDPPSLGGTLVAILSKP